MNLKRRYTVTRTAQELASALGLSPADAAEFEVRSELTSKIIDIVARSGMTHAQVADAADTSRPRLTAILNRNTSRVSTDLLLRILASLGYRATLKVTRIKPAA